MRRKSPISSNLPFGPRPRNPRRLRGQQRPIYQWDAQVSFDPNAFRNFIISQGISVTHFRAIPDPTGFNSVGDNHGVAFPRKSVDNYLYQEGGSMQVLFSSNSEQVIDQAEGVIDHATAYMTLPEYYMDKPEEPVLIMPRDRFYLKDIEIRVVAREKIESNATGIDRLRYPAVSVEFLQDARGVEYQVNVDFEITDEGNIKWISQNRPGWNVEQGRGTVYSIRYRYTPFFVCDHIIHEIRVSQISNPTSGERQIVRMPYQIMVMRENVFRDMNNDPDTAPTDDPRSDGSPNSGGMLGPTQ